ncbi:hypothetical protein KCP78_12240 [Salmonella enterica subsp. enterica]|nr:hypothetical protein KCP78_12240 [Salmonella enterica subsp. enterica]
MTFRLLLLSAPRQHHQDKRSATVIAFVTTPGQRCCYPLKSPRKKRSFSVNAKDNPLTGSGHDRRLKSNRGISCSG